MTDTAPGTPGQGGTAAAPPAAPATPPATPPAGGAPPTPATALPWLEGADEVTVGYVQNKGWKDPLEVTKSYQNLEKLLGADRAGNTIVLPKADASPEELGKFYDRLGRPTAPDGYKLQVPDGAPKEFATAAAAKMHELGIPQKAGEALGAWWNEQANTSLTAQKEQQAQAYQADDQALRIQWGAAFTQELAKAQAAVRGLGVTETQLDQLQAAMGHKATMEFFNKIGSKLGEDAFVAGNSAEKFGSALTPAQAQARIAELKLDKNHIAKLQAKDAAVTAEWKRLHEFAFPEGQ